MTFHFLLFVSLLLLSTAFLNINAQQQYHHHQHQPPLTHAKGIPKKPLLVIPKTAQFENTKPHRSGPGHSRDQQKQQQQQKQNENQKQNEMNIHSLIKNTIDNNNQIVEAKTSFVFNKYYYNCPFVEMGYLWNHYVIPYIHITTWITVAALVTYQCPIRINGQIAEGSFILKANHDISNVDMRKFINVLVLGGTFQGGEIQLINSLFSQLTMNVQYGEELGFVYSSHVVYFYFNSKLLGAIESDSIFTKLQMAMKTGEHYIKTHMK